MAPAMLPDNFDAENKPTRQTCQRLFLLFFHPFGLAPEDESGTQRIVHRGHRDDLILISTMLAVGRRSWVLTRHNLESLSSHSSAKHSIAKFFRMGCGWPRSVFAKFALKSPFFCPLTCRTSATYECRLLKTLLFGRKTGVCRKYFTLFYALFRLLRD
jgi:hypothetical protein